jgi:hypothetical protein
MVSLSNHVRGTNKIMELILFHPTPFDELRLTPMLIS